MDREIVGELTGDVIVGVEEVPVGQRPLLLLPHGPDVEAEDDDQPHQHYRGDGVEVSQSAPRKACTLLIDRVEAATIGARMPMM